MLIVLSMPTLGLANTTIILNQNDTSTVTTTALPSTGMQMRQVEATFGQPAEKQASIGKPPITIWRYADFNVYFEYDRVLHSVQFVPYVRPIQIIIE
jgi:hypothetical protein